MPTAAPLTDTHTAVVGTLLHADAFDLLHADTVAQRSAVALPDAQRSLDRLTAEGIALAADLDGRPSYRLTTDGVRFACELTGETPRAWRA